MKTKNQKGITLIALIITIIVMLILVGVSVSVALNTDLFKTAQGAAKNTEGARANETKISGGQVAIKEGGEDKTYSSLGEYVNSLNADTDTYTLVIKDKYAGEFEFTITSETTMQDIIDESPEPIKSKWYVYQETLLINYNYETIQRYNGDTYVDGALEADTKVLEYIMKNNTVMIAYLMGGPDYNPDNYSDYTMTLK